MKNLPARLRKHTDEVLDAGYPYYGTPEMVREAAAEIERLRLTDAEREAIAHAASRLAGIHYAATLWGLLERTK
jgi:predicted DNA-binding protein (UPF0251 family)